jgi:hypothetical protein
VKLKWKPTRGKKLGEKRYQSGFGKVHSHHYSLIRTTSWGASTAIETGKLEIRTDVRAWNPNREHIGAKNIMNHLISRNIVPVHVLTRPPGNHISSSFPERVLQSYFCVQEVRKLNNRKKNGYENEKCKSEFDHGLAALAFYRL